MRAAILRFGHTSPEMLLCLLNFALSINRSTSGFHNPTRVSLAFRFGAADSHKDRSGGRFFSCQFPRWIVRPRNKEKLVLFVTFITRITST